ncbi:MAG: type II secretion system major pseudopilin GspG [bacterium]
MKRIKQRIEKELCRTEQGFTLIELLVVMIILGMLASLVGPRMFKKLGKSKRQAAQAQISLFETALDTYRLDLNKYPSSLDGLINNPGEDYWDGPYLKKNIIPKDPWNNDYFYESTGSDFTLKSYGADGQPGGSGEDADIPDEAESSDAGFGKVIPLG